MTSLPHSPCAHELHMWVRLGTRLRRRLDLWLRLVLGMDGLGVLRLADPRRLAALRIRLRPRPLPRPRPRPRPLGGVGALGSRVLVGGVMTGQIGRVFPTVLNRSVSNHIFKLRIYLTPTSGRRLRRCARVQQLSMRETSTCLGSASPGLTPPSLPSPPPSTILHRATGAG